MSGRIRHKKRSWLFFVVPILATLCRPGAGAPLDGLQSTLDSAVNSTRDAALNATSNVGTSINSAANNTNKGLQSATNSVGSGLNVTLNATENATQVVTNAGGKAIAGVLNATGLTAAAGGPIAAEIEKLAQNGVRHPIVFWPGYGTSRLRVDVSEQLQDDCPSSGTFHVAFGNPTILEGFKESCIYKYLEIQYAPDEDDFNERFSSQPGVNVTVADFGSMLCAPIPYEPMFLFYEALGYTDGDDFFVACYDWRVSPFQDVTSDPPHLERARQLVEEAYRNTGRPAYLIGHSNGGLQALALLNSTSPEWRSKYVAGLIGYAGNWAGQGGVYAPIISGQSLFADGWYEQAAPAWQSWPSSYMQLADPKVYNSSEVVIQATVNGATKNYTTADSAELFRDANMTLAQELLPNLLGNLSVKTATPGTHFYGFYGSGQQTLVGVTLSSLEQGQKPSDNGNIYAEGDSNQEATDNLSVLEWNETKGGCFDFEMHEEKKVSHLTLPFDPSVLFTSTGIVFKNPKTCSQASSTGTAG